MFLKRVNGKCEVKCLDAEMRKKGFTLIELLGGFNSQVQLSQILFCYLFLNLVKGISSAEWPDIAAKIKTRPTVNTTPTTTTVLFFMFFLPL